MSNLGYIVGSSHSKSPFILEDAIRILMPEKERWIEGKTPGELKKMGSTHWIIENDLEGKISKSIQVRMNYALILVDDCVVYETISWVKTSMKPCWTLLHGMNGGKPDVFICLEKRLRWRLKTAWYNVCWRPLRAEDCVKETYIAAFYLEDWARTCIGDYVESLKAWESWSCDL